MLRFSANSASSWLFRRCKTAVSSAALIGFRMYSAGAHLDRLLGVLEVVEAGENHELGVGHQLAQPLPEGEPDHEGHLDVGHHDVGVELLGQLERLLAVSAEATSSNPLPFPVDLAPDPVADLLLVCRQA